MTRWLALLLVLANVAVFAWRYELRLREARDVPAAPPPLSPNLPGLRLLSELDELPPLREDADAPVTAEDAYASETAPAGADLSEARTADAAVGEKADATAGDAMALGADAPVAAPDAASLTSGSQAAAPDTETIGPGSQAAALDAETLAPGSQAAAQDADPAASDAQAAAVTDAAASATPAAPDATGGTTPAAPPGDTGPADAANTATSAEAPAATTDVPAATDATLPATGAATATRPAATSEIPEAPTFTLRAGTNSGVAANTCIEAGPFPNGKDADALEAWLAPRALSLVRVNRVMRRRQFFWVYLEPRDANEAQEKLADLRARGVQDYLLIQRGGLKNAISLGLFSTQDAVSRRLAEMSAQGFQPVVVPRIEVTDYDWVRASLPVGYTETGTIPAERLAGAAVSPIDCAQIAAAVPGP